MNIVKEYHEKAMKLFHEAMEEAYLQETRRLAFAEEHKAYLNAKTPKVKRQLLVNCIHLAYLADMKDEVTALYRELYAINAQTLLKNLEKYVERGFHG